MDLDFSQFLSGVCGGGLVLALAQFIFNRLIHQVDKLADKVAILEVSQIKAIERIEKLDRIEGDVNDASDRLLRLETIMDRGKH
jgi:hypothetical protein